MTFEIIEKLHILRFGELMSVYEDTNIENGANTYPTVSKGEQILQAEQDFYRYLELFFNTDGSFYVLCNIDCKYVSALRMEPYKDGLLLEALETKPSARRKGYGEAVLKYGLQIAEKRTSKVYSHILKSNTPSLYLHHKCGFSRVSDIAVYIDGSVDKNAYTYCFSFIK